MVSKITVYRMCIRAVYLYFFKKSELRAKLGLNKLNNFFMSSTFLTVKLIARESQKLKTFNSKLVVHIGQEFVVGRGESSFTCHIDDQNGFLTFVTVEVNQVAFNVLDLKIKERGGFFLRKALSTTLMNGSFCYAVHQILNKIRHQLNLYSQSLLMQKWQKQLQLTIQSKILINHLITLPTF